MPKSADELLSQLRSQCLSRGCAGIKGLGVVFRFLDLDFSKKIVFAELKTGLTRYGLTFSDEDLIVLFKALDRDGSGAIDFQEFMKQLRPPMNDLRKSVINEAFNKLDVNRDGYLSVEDLKVIYVENAKAHPKYRSGEWTMEQTLKNFLDALDTPGCPDGKVTREEFLDFYAGVSSTIDEDCYFDLMMRSSYGLPRKEYGQMKGL